MILLSRVSLILISALSIIIAISVLAIAQETSVAAIVIEIGPPIVNCGFAFISRTPRIYLTAAFSSLTFFLVQCLCLIMKLANVKGLRSWYSTSSSDDSPDTSSDSSKQQAVIALYIINMLSLFVFAVMSLMYRTLLIKSQIERARLEAKMNMFPFRNAITGEEEHQERLHDGESDFIPSHDPKMDGKVYTTDENGNPVIMDEEEAKARVGMVMVYASYVSMFFLGALSYIYPSSILENQPKRPQPDLKRRPSQAITGAASKV